MKVVVVGSINMDVVNEVNKHPLPGETIHGAGTAYHPGGKGANQAVAAAKSGGQVQFVGAVGDDPFGPQLIEALQAANIDTTHVETTAGTSGLAFITVAADGENTIILSGGANAQLSPDKLEGARAAIEGADVLLTQNEVPWDTTCRAIEMAYQSGVKVFLNPAPARKVEAKVLAMVDVLVVNETETEVITGIHVDTPDDARNASQVLMQQGVKQVLITLGSRGALYASADRSLHVPAFTVTAVDTTAAGDTFIGALCTQDLTQVESAIRFASAASAIAVTRVGAQPSVPTKAEINSFLAAR